MNRESSRKDLVAFGGKHTEVAFWHQQSAPFQMCKEEIFLQLVTLLKTVQLFVFFIYLLSAEIERKYIYILIEAAALCHMSLQNRAPHMYVSETRLYAKAQFTFHNRTTSGEVTGHANGFQHREVGSRKL